MKEQSPHRGLAVRLVALAAIVSVSGFLLLGFVDADQAHSDEALRTSRLQTAATTLANDEEQARTATRVTSGLDARLGTDMVAANALVDELSNDPKVRARIRAPYARFLDALVTEIGQFRAGAVAAAIDTDKSRVDPEFDRLQRSLTKETDDATAAAHLAENSLRVGSTAVLGFAATAISLLVWDGNRRRRRAVACATKTEALRASERRFRALVNNGDDVIIVTDRNGRIQEVSNSAEHVLDIAPGIGTGCLITDVVHPEEAEAAAIEVARALSKGSAGPTTWRCRDTTGAWRYLEASITNLMDLPEVAGLVFNVRDVSERHRLESELRHQAFHDALTGLANRALLSDRVSHALARRHSPAGTALMILDLDGFKHLNDSLGHAAGDHALAVVADRLRAVSRPSDTVARLGGDEFAILIEELASPCDARTLADRALEAVTEPFEWDGHPISVGVSIGAALGEPGLRGPDDLVRNADVALYAAKADGRGRIRFFEHSMNRATQDRFELELELRDAIRNEEFVVQYQPIMALDTDRLVGLEALVRWQHPTRGLVPPDAFVPVAEETGAIVPIGRWVLDRACRDVAAWTLGHPDVPNVRVSVNVSAQQLHDHQIVDDVAAALSTSGLDPDQLVLEITETALVHDMESVRVLLNALKALGVHLSVDDFGTGYSSLSYLRQFPVDTVKIDKAFVDNVARGDDDASFLEAILRLGETLHLHTLAEGIETEEQAAVLQRLGCQFGQGFLYARAIDLHAIDAVLAAHPQPSEAPLYAELASVAG